jgi:hypothetical protein
MKGDKAKGTEEDITRPDEVKQHKKETPGIDGGG